MKAGVILVGYFEEYQVKRGTLGEVLHCLPFALAEMVPALQAQGHNFEPSYMQAKGLDDRFIPEEQLRAWVADNPGGRCAVSFVNWCEV